MHILDMFREVLLLIIVFADLFFHYDCSHVGAASAALRSKAHASAVLLDFSGLQAGCRFYAASQEACWSFSRRVRWLVTPVFGVWFLVLL